MDTTTQTAVTADQPGRWLGPRGIFRHRVATVEQVRADLDKYDGRFALHTVVTAVSFEGGPVGELIRWVDDDEVGYEARIHGTDEHGGLADVGAFSVDSLGGLAKVANDLRYEWEIITGVYAHEGVVWQV